MWIGPREEEEKQENHAQLFITTRGLKKKLLQFWKWISPQIKDQSCGLLDSVGLFELPLFHFVQLYFSPTTLFADRYVDEKQKRPTFDEPRFKPSPSFQTISNERNLQVTHSINDTRLLVWSHNNLIILLYIDYTTIILQRGIPFVSFLPSITLFFIRTS